MERSSSRYSVVPDFIRDRFREKKRRERDEMMEERRRPMEESSESRYSDEDRKALDELSGEAAKGFAKGGMVKKGKHRGDGVCTKGHTKGRMY